MPRPRRPAPPPDNPRRVAGLFPSRPRGPAARAQSLLTLLEDEYGRPRNRRRPALAVLIGTILSQNTNDTNSDRAFRSLWKAFGSWEAVADASLPAIARAIRCGGLSRVKAPRIRDIIRKALQERGRPELEFLQEWPRGKAYDYLLALPGVGAKTASCVLLFAFGKPVLPVDTHVHRLSKRLDLVDEKATIQETQVALERAVPPKDRHSFHMNLIAHGRAVCRPRPRCDQCALLALCPYGKAHVKGRRKSA